MNTRNSKTNEPHRLSLNLSERLDLKAQIKTLLFKACLFITPGKI